MASLFDGTTEQFRKYVPVNLNYMLRPLLPSLDALTEELLGRFLGDDTAALILSQSGQTLDADDDRAYIRALSYSRSAIAKLGFAAYVPFAEVQIDEDGITVSASEGRKAAFEYQTNKLVKSLLEDGWNQLDKLLQLIGLNPAMFPDWSNSTYFKEHNQSLFKSPAQFSSFYPIGDRWLTFWALRPFIRAVEENQGESGLAKIDALPGSVSDAQKEKIKKSLLRSIAYQSVIDALPNLSVEIAGASVQVNYASQYGNATYFTPPTREQLDWVLEKLQKQADLAWTTFTDGLAAAVPTEPTDEGDPLGLLNAGLPLVML